MTKLELKSSHEVVYTVDVADVESIFYCKPTDPDILTVLMKDGKRLYCDEVCPVQEEPVSIWHDANQPPEINTPILVRTYDNIVESTKRYDDNLIPWEDRIKRDDITHWCYVEDLLKL